MTSTLANEISTLDSSMVVAVADSEIVPNVQRSAPAVPPPATKSKSKKKKNSSNMSSTGSQGENTGRWTAEEHRLFLQGLEQHGKGWKKIASLIQSRTVVQIRTHAQVRPI
jgi:SHAQKYF class myb-like DNA-binding protein